MTMSYSSQLKGWAIDRVIEIKRLAKTDANGVLVTADEVIAEAKKLVEYSFSEDEAERVIRERIEQEVYDREVQAAVALKPKSNALDAIKAMPDNTEGTQQVEGL